MLPRHVYVHVPFCARRCTYCDFAIAVRRVAPVHEFVDALRAEIALRFPADDTWRADTLYLGGGTPSRLGDGIARVLDVVRDRIALAEDAEITVEANPDDVTRDAAAAWRAAGVNRLSIGAQSFDDRVLAWMHRTHDAAAVGRAVDAARAAGIDTLSVDLIFALPDAVERSWSRDLERALALAPAHVSLYGLTIESGTPLGRRRSRAELVEAPEERYEREFLEAHDRMTAAGLDHYEVSNFGTRNAHARHNAAYWAGVPYGGLGPSAHEFDGDVRRWNVPAYAEWLARVGRGADPMLDHERLTVENRLAEQVYLGLRTTAGLRVSGAELARAAPWIAAGWAALASGDRLTLTPTGWLRLDALAADLTLIRSRS